MTATDAVGNATTQTRTVLVTAAAAGPGPGGGAAPPAGGGAPTSTPPVDKLAPVVGALRMTNKKFRLGSGLTPLDAKAAKAKAGTTFVSRCPSRARPAS